MHHLSVDVLTKRIAHPHFNYEESETRPFELLASPSPTYDVVICEIKLFQPLSTSV